MSSKVPIAKTRWELNRAGKCYPEGGAGKVCTVTAHLQEKVAPCSQKPGELSAFHTAQSPLILLLQEIPGCSFSLGVFIIKSQTEDKKTSLLKWCNFRVSGF